MVCDTLLENDENAVYVDGDPPKPELDAIIESRPKFICNNNLMTTGYDLPWLDMVAILRSTLSKSLFEQMAYRGSRLYSGKTNFLLLDMGGNLMTHGALGSPFEGVASKKEVDKPKGRVCPMCETYVQVKDRQCVDCGYEFPPPEQHEIKHSATPDTDSNPLDQVREPQHYNVIDVKYHARKSKKGDAMIVVTYLIDNYTTFTEYLLPFHAHDLPRNKAWGFLSQANGWRVTTNLNDTIDTFLIYCETSPKPNSIIVQPQKNNPKYNDITRIYVAKPVEVATLEDEIPWL
jgi:hypothetical protein